MSFLQIKLALLGLCAANLGTLQAQTTIVQWGGNYVATHKPFAHTLFNNSSTDDWLLAYDGTYGYSSRLLDLTPSRDLTPASGYTVPAFRNGIFFGGFSSAINGSPYVPGDTTGTSSGYRVVFDNSNNDRILYQGSGNRAQIRGALVFEKDDFLREASATTVSFNANSELSFTGILDGWRPLARWLVRDGSTWYVSQATLAAQTTYNVAENRTLSNPGSSLWAVFTPIKSDTNGNKFHDSAPATYSSHTFSDVTAVGIYFDSFSASTSLGGTSFTRFAMEGISVKANVQPPPVTVLQSCIINDTIPDAMMPTSMAKAANGDLILAFNDGGDLSAGSSAYLVRSTDLGASWSAPYQTFQSTDPKIGTLNTIASLPDGSLLMGIVECTHPLYPNQNLAVRTTGIRLFRSTDNGNTFSLLTTLNTPPQGLSTIMGTVAQFPNGDLVMSSYILPNISGPQAGYTYGCGFFRSTDGGLTWGDFEKAFQDPPPSIGQSLYFTECSYQVVEHESGNPLDDPIVAFARIDSDPTGQYSSGVPNSLWKCFSSDNGATWSTPVPVGISGIWPATAQVGGYSYLMVCGDRQASPTRKVSFFTSRDGENYAFRGYPPYTKTGGCVSSATGGAQAIVELSPGVFYVAYYAKDPSLGGTHQTYLEGCKIQVGTP